MKRRRIGKKEQVIGVLRENHADGPTSGTASPYSGKCRMRHRESSGPIMANRLYSKTVPGGVVTERLSSSMKFDAG